MAQERQSNYWRWMWGIFLLALALRLGCVIWLQNRLDATDRDFLIAGDAEGYWELGKAIATGDDFAVHTPPRYVHRMPGFPAILAASILCFGENLFAARCVLALLAATLCWLVGWLGTRIHSRIVGLIAAALVALSPAAIGFSGLILSETAFAAAMMLGLLCVHRLIQTIRSDESQSSGSVIGLSLLSGAALALGVYMKPSWILNAPLFGAVMILFDKNRKRSLTASAVMLLGMFVCLLPWGLRNYSVSGHFTLTTFWMGPSLYDGLNPDATGESDMQFFDQDRLSATLTEYEVDRAYRRRALDFARDNPRQVLNLAIAKLWRYWKPWPNADQFDHLLIRIALCLYTLPLFLLSIVGVTKLRERFWPIVICAGPIFYFAAIHAVFVSSLRYRLPAEAPLAVLAAMGVVEIYKSRFSRTDMTTQEGITNPK